MVVESKINQVTKEVVWQDARTLVMQVNPKLASLIDQVEPDNDLSFLLASYCFGELIIHKGEIILPNSHTTSHQVKPVPLILSLNRSNEVFSETIERIVPLEFLAPGQLWGGYDALHPTTNPIHRHCNISAGARSIFMLPKITDATAHQRIQREFSIKTPSPKSLWDQAKVFSAIVNHPRHSHHWSSQILFFTDKWLQYLHKPRRNMAWLELRQYLYESSSLYFQSWAHQLKAHSATSTLSHPKLKNKLDTSSLDVTKHLLNIAAGIVPGYCAAGKSEIAAPISIIEKTYVEVYGLKNYLPIIMQPACLSKEKQLARYFSLCLPSYFNNCAKPFSSTNIIYQMRQLKKALKLMLGLYEQTTDEKQETNQVQYNFYHTTADINHDIQLASTMPTRDPLLLSTYYQYPHRIFPDASPFVRGCIQILNNEATTI